MIHRQLAALLALALGACQAMRSEPVEYGAGGVANGLQYAAPKALMQVELIDRAGELILGVSQPFLVGDPEATYTLSASSGLLANRDYRFVVDPQTRLLTYLASVSEGQASKILENVARGIGGIGALPSAENTLAGERAVFSTVIDPFEFAGCEFAVACTFTKLNDTLHSHALDYFGCAGARSFPEQCQRLEGNPEYFSITLAPMFTLTRSAAKANASSAASACSSSICYRAPAPYRLGVRVAGVTDAAQVVLLPNRAPMMSLNVPAGVFATARAHVVLAQGMPATVAVKQDNELLAITAIPITIIKGFFGAVGEVFQLRINYDSKAAEVLKQDQLRHDAEDGLRQAERLRQAARIAEAAAAAAVKSKDPKAPALQQQARAASQQARDLEPTANLVRDSVGEDPNAPQAENTLAGAGGDVDAPPSSDATGEDVADVQHAAITTLSAPRRMFDVPVWPSAGKGVVKTPGANGADLGKPQ
jgi:hypothetical protein